MNIYSTFATTAILALAATTATAEPEKSDAAAAASSSVKTQAIQADPAAAPQAGSLPRDGEWYNVPAPLGKVAASVSATAPSKPAPAASE